MSPNATPEVTLVPVDSEREAQWVRELLARSGLPTADLGGGTEPAPTGGRPTLYSVEADGDRVGCVGLERYGDDGLLRSLAVAEPYRGRGYGRAAVRTLQSRARDEGVDTLYLLTTTAAAFFAALGYERTERSAVPGELRESAEFGDLCPESATVMRRRL